MRISSSQVYEELQRQRGSITSLSVSSLCVSAARLSWVRSGVVPLAVMGEWGHSECRG